MLSFRLLTLLFLLSALPAHAQSFSGLIRVVDADTIWVNDIKVRLHGIDAPEKAQTCTLKNGRAWACGRWATQQMRERYHGKAAHCSQTDTDRHGRSVARCSVGGRDMGADLVLAGIAQAFRKYSKDYIDAEKEAFFAGRGMWRGDVQAPSDYRAAARVAPPAPDPSCAIKGNISSGGKIYHLPGQENYAITKINSSSGERWFCTEAEAKAAGWRRAKR